MAISKGEIQSLRAKMLADKDFLYQLHNSNAMQAKNLLNFAKDSSLKLLIKIIHHVAKGEIEIREDIFNEIVKRNKLKILVSKFEPKGKVKSLTSSSRQEILTNLYKLCPVYKYILHPLFWRKISA